MRSQHHVISRMLRVCQASCIQKHATLVRICGSYLWPASLPKEPIVRRGLEGLTQVGSGGFCASVFTSGSISEGEGVSLAPAMALFPSRALPPAESGQYASSSWCRNRLTYSDRRRRKTASPVSVVLHEGGGRASVSLPHHGFLRHTEGSSSLSPAHRALLHP